MISLDDLKNEILKILQIFPHKYHYKIKTMKNIYDSIMFYTSNLDSKINISTRIYRILNGIDFMPTCLVCGKSMLDRNIVNLNIGYRLHCCQQCAKNSSHRKNLYEQTCLKRFGVKNASSSQIVKTKKENTNMTRYGVSNSTKRQSVKDKIKDTNLKRYNCSCSLQAPLAKEKTKNTILSKYKTTSYSKTKDFIEKITNTNRKNFGVDYPNQDPEFRRNAQKRYIFENIKFDSAPEVALFIYARDHDIYVEFQPNAIFEYVVNSKTYHYQPDFKINDEYVEIKGIQFFENRDPTKKMINPYDRSLDDVYEGKHQCMIKNNVKIITDYSKYIDYVKEKYGKNYLQTFKNENYDKIQ